MTPERQIIEPIAAPDDNDAVSVYASFKDFYAARHRRVFEALVLTLRNEELARDASAEGMARAFQNWSKVGSYSNPSGWVYRVGLNWGTSRLRKLSRESLRGNPPEVVVSEQQQFNPELDAAIADLPVEQRAVIVLRYHLDWSEAQTAEALGIAAGTVKSRLSRAIDRLSAVLQDRRSAHR